MNFPTDGDGMNIRVSKRVRQKTLNAEKNLSFAFKTRLN